MCQALFQCFTLRNSFNSGNSPCFNAWGDKSQHSLDRSLGRRILDQLGLDGFSTSLCNEGGAIHVDGEGTLITTESVLLNPNRNPGVSKAEFEACFARHLGIRKTIWLPGDPQYVTGDMTDGHVDGVCAFARPGVLLVDATHEQGSVYADVVRENRRALELATDAQGRHFELLDLYEATAAVDHNAEVFCASYTNFYIANGAIIMPAYGIAADQEAAAQLAHAFPGRQIVPVRIDHIAHGGGGIQVAGIVAGARTAVNAQGKSRFCVEHAWWSVGSNQWAEKLNTEPGQQGAAPGQTEQHQAEQDGGAAQVFGFFGQRVQLRANAVNGRFDAAIEQLHYQNQEHTASQQHAFYPVLA